MLKEKKKKNKGYTINLQGLEAVSFVTKGDRLRWSEQ